MLKLPVPEIEGGKPYVIAAKPNEYQKAYMTILAERSEQIHSGCVDPRVDNMLKITNEARLLGLDARCINPNVDNYPDSKVNLLIEKVLEIYADTTEQKGVQAIFCDIAVNGKTGGEETNESEIPFDDEEAEETEEEQAMDIDEQSASLYDVKFSVYKYIKEELIRRGIPEDEICFAGDAKDQRQRLEMYAQLRSGTKRIVLASTSKMGTGANIQNKLCALHNLDIPWRPADLEQRMGRIVRQGNENSTVKIFNYVTEGTFDAYMLNLIVTKQKFISQLMSGKSPARTCADVDETVLNYSEMQAIASGDPRIKEKIELDTEVSRLKLLESEHQNSRYQLEDMIRINEGKLSVANKQLPIAEKDKEYAAAHELPEGEFHITLNGKTYDERKEAGEALDKAIVTMLGKKEPMKIGEYRGFDVHLTLGGMGSDAFVELRRSGGLTYYTDLRLKGGLGNVIRLENILKTNIDKRISEIKGDIKQLERDIQEAERTKDAPFELADELAKKAARLEQLNLELNLDKHDEVVMNESEDEEHDSPDEEIKKNPPKRKR